MKISLLIFLIGFVINSKEKEAFIYDLSPNTAFTLPIPENGYIPENVYYFRMDAIKEHDYEFQHFVLDDGYLDFKVKICGYKSRPTDEEIINVGSQSCTSYLNQRKKKEGNYYSYSYSFTSGSMDYFVIELLNNQSLNFLKVNALTDNPNPVFIDVDFNYDVRLYFLNKIDYYYIMPTPKYNNLEFYISVKKDIPTTNFQVNFCSSSYSRPNTSEEDSLFECGNVLSVKKNHTKGDYDTYIYPYTNKTDKPYIALHVKNIVSLDYLGVYTYCLDKLFSINLNESYKVNMTQFQQQYLQAGHNYYFKMPAESNKNFGIRLSLYKNETSNYKIYISEYKENPSENEILGGEGNYGNPLKGVDSIEKDYRHYEYQFATSANVTYLVIRIDNYKDINYLQIQVYPKKI